MCTNMNFIELIFNSFTSTALDETAKIIDSMGGWCRTQKVDISRREEVYAAAAEIKSKYGNVSAINQCQL